MNSHFIRIMNSFMYLSTHLLDKRSVFTLPITRCFATFLDDFKAILLWKFGFETKVSRHVTSCYFQVKPRHRFKNKRSLNIFIFRVPFKLDFFLWSFNFHLDIFVKFLNMAKFNCDIRHRCYFLFLLQREVFYVNDNW